MIQLITYYKYPFELKLQSPKASLNSLFFSWIPYKKGNYFHFKHCLSIKIFETFLDFDQRLN